MFDHLELLQIGNLPYVQTRLYIKSLDIHLLFSESHPWNSFELVHFLTQSFWQLKLKMPEVSISYWGSMTWAWFKHGKNTFDSNNELLRHLFNYIECYFRSRIISYHPRRAWRAEKEICLAVFMFVQWMMVKGSILNCKIMPNDR